ncbi:MAG: hypothetical protein AAGN46_10310 [Acidobacteriota bacterium]
MSDAGTPAHQRNTDAICHQLLEHLGSFYDEVRAVEVLAPPDTGFWRLDASVVHRVEAYLDAAIRLFGEVDALDLADEMSAGGVDVGPSALAEREMADMAWVASAELSRHRRALLASPERVPWEIAADVDRSLGLIRRTVAALESALRRRLGDEPIERSAVDLDEALAVRRRLARLWISVQRLDRRLDKDGSSRTQLEGFVDRVALLRRQPIYMSFRILDRYELRQLQKRVRALLDDPEAAAEDGRRLWQDVVGFVSLTMRIDERDELRRHDRQLVKRVLRALEETPETSLDLVDGVALRDLASLEPSLDTLLLGDRPIELDTLREPLRRLLARFDPS